VRTGIVPAASTTRRVELAGAVTRVPADRRRARDDAPAAQGDSHLARGRWLRIISTNDFHGTLEPRRDANGIARGGAVALAAAIAAARAECVAPSCVSLLLDGGDEFQGTPASNWAFGRPVTALFNQLGYAAAALGNHEFDWGQDTLRARMREARYPVLGANVRDTAGRDVPWIPDDTIVVAGSLRVGIIGLATVATPATTRPSNVADLRFVDPVPVVNEHARRLRARGADVVVVVAHAGTFCDRDQVSGCNGEIIDLARGITERVDAIVAGHIHAPATPLIAGIPIVQARSHGSALGVLDLALDGGRPPVVALRDVLPATSGPAAPRVDSLVRAAVTPVIERMRQPVAQIAERIAAGTGEPLGDLIADAQRTAGAADVAVMNSGGVRAALDSGLATYGSVFEVQPFGNVLMRITIRGRDLRSYLERLVGRDRLNAHLSGAVLTIDTARAAGRRITSVVMSDGRPLDDEGTYRLVLSDFLAAGGDGLNVTERAIQVEELGIVDIDALIGYLQSQPAPVRAPRDRRLVIRSP
jgi:5'-nucleotidase